MKTPTRSEGPQRRLGAALFADVVNYARLMGDDEVGTHAAVNVRLRFLGQLAETHRGEVVQRRGDGIFMLFDSAVNCACFALEAQRAMQSQNASLPSAQH